MTPEKQDSPRIALWKASREMLYLIMPKLLNLPMWSNQTTYLASQIDIIARIAAMIEQQDGKMNVGTVFQLRTLLEAVANAITGCNDPIYADGELEKLSIERRNRGPKSCDQKERQRKYHPRQWTYKAEAELVWNRGNCVVHADADTSFFLRSDGLAAIDLKALALGVFSLMAGAETYLKSIDCFFTDEEFNPLIDKFKTALSQVVSEGEASILGDLHPFEARVYAELYKRGAHIKLSEKIAPADPPPDSQPTEAH